MEFTAQLFTTDISFSHDTKYKKEFSGAFYDAYLDDVGVFHMAIEDKESLVERIRFYEKFFSKEYYPIFTNNNQTMKTTEAVQEVLSQVLGLPSSLLTRTSKTSKDVFSIPPAEILSRIHFEEGLNRGYGFLDKEDNNPKILYSDRYALIGCINYLISKGFFLQNLERVLNPEADNFNYYPVRIDVEKLLPYLLKNKENSVKLFMDFCTNPYIFNRVAFKRTFGRMESLSLEEQVRIAFEPLDSIAKDLPEKEFRLCMRRYFLSIARKLINEFFYKEYQFESLLSIDILDHDLKTPGAYFGYVYYGLSFDMFGIDYHHFRKEEDQVVCDYYPESYVLLEGDKKKMMLAFDTVKKYFDRHLEFAYMPHVFLKMMGLPYPAYEYLKKFDFMRGNASQMLSLLPFESEEGSYRDCGIVLPCISRDGLTSSEGLKEGNIARYLKNTNGLFYNYSFCLGNRFNTDFFFVYTGKKQSFLDLTRGNAKRIQSSLTDFITYLLQGQSDHAAIIQVVEKISKQDENNIIPLFERLFSLMKDGYTIKEAFYQCPESEDLEFSDFAMLFYIITMQMFDQESGKYLYNEGIKFNQKMTSFRMDSFYDPYLNFPLVNLGRNFVVYKNKDFFYMDSQDEDRIGALKEIYSQRLFKDGQFPMTFVFYGNEFQMSKHNGTLTEFFGLPDCVSKSDVFFEKGISIFERKDHQLFLKNDPYFKVLSQYVYPGLAQGIFFLQPPSGLNFFVNKTALPKRVSSLLNPINEIAFLKEILPNQEQENLTIDNIERTSDFLMNKASFQEATSTQDKLVYALIFYYQTIFEEYITGVKEDPKSYLDYYVHFFDKFGKIYVMPGRIFNAYSKDGKEFSFLNRDKEALLFVINSCFNDRIQQESPSLEDVVSRLVSTGIPYCFYKELFSVMKKRKRRLTKKDLEKHFTFIDEEYPEESLPYAGRFSRLYQPQFNAIYDSMQVRNLLVKEGLYLAPTSYVYPALEGATIEQEKDKRELFEELDDIDVKLAEELSGDTKHYLLPDEVMYEFLVHSYSEQIKICTEETELIYRAKKLLLLMYQEDSKIIYHSLNFAYRQKKSIAELTKYYSVLMDRLHLEKEADFDKAQDLLSYILRFFFFVLQKLVEVKAKKILIKQ